MKHPEILSAAAVVGLCLAHLVTAANRSMFAAIVPLLGDHYRYSNTALGVLMGPAFAVTYAIAAIACGLLADRRPARLLVIAGLTVMTLASAITAIGDSYGVFLVGQVVLGLGQAALVSAAMLLIVRGATDDRPARGIRPPALSLFTSASALGRSAGLMLAGAMLALLAGLGISLSTSGWRVLPVLSMLATGTLAIMFTRLLPAEAPRTPMASARIVGGLPAGLIPLFIAAVGPVLVGQSLAAWVPMMLVRARGFDVAQAAAFFGLIVLVMAAGGQILGGLATQRFGWVVRHPIAANAGCLILAEPCLLIATRAQPAWLIAAGLAGTLVLAGIAGFIALDAVQRRSPPARRGAVTGLFLSLVTLAGTGGGPMLTGLLSDARLTDVAADALGLAMMLVNGASAAAISLVALVVFVRHRGPVAR